MTRFLTVPHTRSWYAGFAKPLRNIRKNIFACLFSVYNTIRLSPHEQVCLIRLRFKKCFFHYRANVALRNICERLVTK